MDVYGVPIPFMIQSHCSNNCRISRMYVPSLPNTVLYVSGSQSDSQTVRQAASSDLLDCTLLRLGMGTGGAPCLPHAQLLSAYCPRPDKCCTFVCARHATLLIDTVCWCGSPRHCVKRLCVSVKNTCVNVPVLEYDITPNVWAITNQFSLCQISH